jgi:hypothetical protein
VLLYMISNMVQLLFIHGDEFGGGALIFQNRNIVCIFMPKCRTLKDFLRKNKEKCSVQNLGSPHKYIRQNGTLVV